VKERSRVIFRHRGEIVELELPVILLWLSVIFVSGGVWGIAMYLVFMKK
jgi:hypothetical protein